jgi:hypothetical protein
MPAGKPYPFSVTIGENCARQMRTFHDLAEKLKMPVEDSMVKATVTHLLSKGWSAVRQRS